MRIRLHRRSEHTDDQDDGEGTGDTAEETDLTALTALTMSYLGSPRNGIYHVGGRRSHSADRFRRFRQLYLEQQ
ncbi:MAG: hypothetical protein V8R40_00155 [Dysosmobacter sp.]